MTKALFISAIFNLKINGDLESGIEIWDKIKITNNKSVINNLVSNNNLQQAIGGLEMGAIKNADAIFYAVGVHEIDNKTDDIILCNYLASCKIFLNDLWLLKDHCADLMMGYIQYPYKDKSSI